MIGERVTKDNTLHLLSESHKNKILYLTRLKVNLYEKQQIRKA